jgi:hypothetical protein
MALVRNLLQGFSKQAAVRLALAKSGFPRQNRA